MKRIVSIMLPLLIIFFSYNVFVQPIISPSYIEALAYKVGSSNANVKKIEQKLKELGYFKGTPDNYYGADTKTAVTKFQQDKKLKVDGIVGDQTLGALGISTQSSPAAGKKNNLQSSEVTLLTRAINGEARGEPYIGQVAVGAVIMNRTRDPRFPNTIAGVVYQPGAFTAIADGQIHAGIEGDPQKAATDAMNGWDPSGGAVYYFNPAKATSKWIWSRPVIKVIGKHRFCK
jgi:N-acetylmuramoyl-L-alanine amidase